MDKNNTTIHQTLDQARAKAAWRLVQETRKALGNNFEKYKTLVKRFPALVNHNGLGQTIAFLKAGKKKDGTNAEDQLLKQLSSWLILSDLNKDLSSYAPPYINKCGLPECIVNNDSRSYIQATREALAFLDYLRRFADGPGDDDAEKGKEDEAK